MQNAGCLHVVAEISIQVQRNSPPPQDNSRISLRFRSNLYASNFAVDYPGSYLAR
jgi:hypothetical protein